MQNGPWILLDYIDVVVHLFDYIGTNCIHSYCYDGTSKITDEKEVADCYDW